MTPCSRSATPRWRHRWPARPVAQGHASPFHDLPQAGFGDGTLGPDEEETLAALGASPAPLPDFAAFLRQIAAGQLPPIPDGLPGELRQWVEQLVNAIRDAGRG